MAANLAALANDVETPVGLRDFVEFQGGILYVAHDHVTDSRVVEFEMRLARLGLLHRKKGCALAEISQLRSNKRNVNKQNTTGVDNRNGELATAIDFLRQGVAMGASDIHFKFLNGTVEVKMRVDGYLNSYFELTERSILPVIQAMYVAADGKNTSQWGFNKPIAARIVNRDVLPEGLYAVRFASMPADRGGVVVLRLLYDSVNTRSVAAKKEVDTTDLLRNLGFRDNQITDLQEMASSPNGIILITGPTGAGKSTTLKYTMQWLNANYPHLNILTVEDPPEYPIVGATQIPVLVQDDDAEDLGARSRVYGSVIATTLRLDPDVLMIGEIRDGSSAIAAMRAAETGHRVWSTLHANDAWETVTRMTDLLREGEMAEPLSVLANTQNLTGLVAQRLVPRLCPNCKIPLTDNMDKMPDNVLNELFSAIPNFDAKKVYLRGDGCDTCVPMANGDKQKQHSDNRRGIKGRTVVCEVIRPDQPLLDIARNKGIPQARRYWLKHKGGRTIIDHALEKIMEGVIDPVVARDFVGPLISGEQSLASMDSEILD